MSGYRSLKRVLGESNLERKCRWLFGICVGGLIILAFFSVGRIAENLIDDTAQYKGRGVARVELFLMHWQRLTNKEEDKDRYEESRQDARSGWSMSSTGPRSTAAC